MALATSGKTADAPVRRRSTAAPSNAQPASFGDRLQRSLQRYNAALAKTLPGSTPTQVKTLDALGRLAPCTNTALVTDTGIDRSTMADTLRRLERRGAIARTRKKGDQRAWATRLTAEGSRLLREVRKAREKTDKAMEEPIMRFLQPGD